jgi:hypothetical protein
MLRLDTDFESCKDLRECRLNYTLSASVNTGTRRFPDQVLAVPDPIAARQYESLSIGSRACHSSGGQRPVDHW